MTRAPCRSSIHRRAGSVRPTTSRRSRNRLRPALRRGRDRHHDRRRRRRARGERGRRDGCDALFVAGGDGTLNEAINGLASAAARSTRSSVGIIPFGTGNDFAAALGLPAGARRRPRGAASRVASCGGSRRSQRPCFREHLGRRVHRRGLSGGDAAAEDHRRTSRLPDRRRAGADGVRSRRRDHHARDRAGERVQPPACTRSRSAIHG